ncbi:hypothetical protein ACFY0F_05635 [Streptomyces sp. NPDC001544]|uniref:hypothetical protein n=1 Tax=Streptomyces sp. NPDC001544 TaxID=3364584 RepID=UPI0036875471
MATMTAKRVLTAEAVLLGSAVLGLLLWELPGLRREMKIWRMAGSSSGIRHRR